jgi:hypothetical protein
MRRVRLWYEVSAQSQPIVTTCGPAWSWLSCVEIAYGGMPSQQHCHRPAGVDPWPARANLIGPVKFQSERRDDVLHAGLLDAKMSVTYFQHQRVELFVRNPQKLLAVTALDIDDWAGLESLVHQGLDAPRHTQGGQGAAVTVGERGRDPIVVRRLETGAMKQLAQPAQHQLSVRRYDGQDASFGVDGKHRLGKLLWWNLRGACCHDPVGVAFVRSRPILNTVVAQIV